MFHTVRFFSAFGVVEPVSCTNQIASDSPDAFKRHALADITVFFVHAVHS